MATFLSIREEMPTRGVLMGLDPLLIEGAVQTAAEILVEAIRAELEPRRKSGSDSLVDSFHWVPVKRYTYSVTSSNPAARYLEEGTRPHPIKPVRRKSLHYFKKDGTERFSKYVIHPGTMPVPYIQAAVAASAEERRQAVLTIFSTL